MSTLDTIIRHRRVACPACKAKRGEACHLGPFSTLTEHSARIRAYRKAFPSGRRKGSGTAPESRAASVRVPSTEYARVKAWLPGAVKLFLDGK